MKLTPGHSKSLYRKTVKNNLLLLQNYFGWPQYFNINGIIDDFFSFFFFIKLIVILLNFMTANIKYIGFGMKKCIIDD